MREKKYNWEYISDKTVRITEYSPRSIDGKPDWLITGTMVFHHKYSDVLDVFIDICHAHQSLLPIYKILEEDINLFDEYAERSV